MSGITLIDDLRKLKNTLNEMNKDIIFQSGNISVRDNCWDNMKDNLQTIGDSNKIKNNIVKIDCGGVTFSTTKQTLLNCKNSLFEAIVNDPEFNLDQEIFFDRDPFFFELILEYLRTGELNYRLLSKDQKKKLLEEAKYYQVLGILNYLAEKLKDIELVSFEYSGSYSHKGKTAGTNILEDVKTEDLNTGICAKSPGTITFKLNCDWDFKELEIGGFKGDTAIWYPDNGSGAQILTSLDGKNFTKVGKIPSGYGKEKKLVKLTKTAARYIRFQHTSYLGIGYLKIIKIDEE